MVDYNVDSIILDGECFFFLGKKTGKLNSLNQFTTSLHAGVSTTESQIHPAILKSAFINAVEDYMADDVMYDEGSGYEA